VDLSPKLVNPKLPLLPYKITSSHGVSIGFWRLLVMPSCYYFELKDPSLIHALGLILKAFFVAKRG